LLTARPPFTGDSPVAVAYKQVNEAPAPPSSLNADVPARLDAVVMKALSKNPSNRYQTAEEFSADLDRVIAGQEVEATPLMPAAIGDATQVISRPAAHTAVLPPTEEPKGSGRKVWLGVLIGVLLFALLAGAGYLLVTSLTDEGEQQPLIELADYRGRPYLDVKRELEDAGLRVERTTRETDRSEEVGTVLEQDPEAGRSIAEGGTVTLTVGVAPDTVEVPDVAEMTVSEAQAALREADLTLGSTLEEPSADVTAGLVIRSDPPADAEVEPGTAVDIFVSTGPEMVEVPDVSSACLSYGGASQLIRAAGLLVAKGDPVPSTDPPQCDNPSRIIAQEPLAGTTVEAGSTVTVFPGGGGDV
jgi:beta-lactam-binding protein with PASTA domain